jgi:hypothetical protein
MDDSEYSVFSQDLRHGLWKRFPQGEYVPSSKDVMAAKKAAWQRSVSGTPAREAAKLASENEALKEWVLQEEERKRKKQQRMQGMRDSG